MTLTFDLVTSKFIGVIYWPWPIFIQSTMTVTHKLFKILSGHDVANGRTDRQTDGRPHRWTFVGYFFCLKLPNKRLTEWMENSHRWTFVGYFSTQQVTICLPGQTDGGHTIIRPKLYFGRIKRLKNMLIVLSLNKRYSWSLFYFYIIQNIRLNYFLCHFNSKESRTHL